MVVAAAGLVPFSSEGYSPYWNDASGSGRAFDYPVSDGGALAGTSSDEGGAVEQDASHRAIDVPDSSGGIAGSHKVAG